MGTLEQTIMSEAGESRNVQRPSPEGEYSQAAGSAQQPNRLMIWSNLHGDMQQSKDGSGIASLVEYK